MSNLNNNTKSLQAILEIANNLPKAESFDVTELENNIANNSNAINELENGLNSHIISTSAHNDIRILVNDINTKLNNFLDIDDTTADQLSEVLQMIYNNEGTIDSLTSSKVNVLDIIDNLTTNVSDKPISAAQGVVLKGLIDALQNLLNTLSSTVSTHTDNTSNPHNVTLSQLGVTATATELNYVDGVTSNIQTQLNKLSSGITNIINPVTVTSTDGVAYAATTPSIAATSISELKGMKLVIIPNITSTSASNVTLDINGLGAKGIKRWDNLNTSEWWSFTNSSWFVAGYPVTVTFNGSYWMIEGMNKPYASDLQGSVSIDKGGTGATTAEAARTNLGLATETWIFTLEDGSKTTKAVYIG